MSKISIANQAGAIRSYFPDGCLYSSKDKLVWIGDITPSPISLTYTIKITYSYKDGVKAYVANPKPLPLATVKSRLPHVYSHEEQRLCLYYPSGKEWDSSKYLVHTIFPWASEWLFYYELWVVTGNWLGGGKYIELGEIGKVKEEQNEAK
ncbi:hypothetical protein EZS27_012949 [termite gut metagenome]|uniref:Type II CBASS E2 protein domain-containing protein n=1 Tax=termite gut metagenome TaxID=433724 RepID=A0A5J4RZU8_9ZZZZ